MHSLHRDALQGTIEAQERDIDELKKSVYELSYMLSMQVRLIVAARALVVCRSSIVCALPRPTRTGGKHFMVSGLLAVGAIFFMCGL